ncbi:uncharacterized protein LOC122388265 [Amphibalanus amphitrite]|uniref:uncharacterized protein LOC122388265 n=1 Tax=Amphibalanus amphitrite TaxID=1232801 RepID=UPI001C8FC77C|nr:uncharacterized protein LOC122388265 [Amphibalanus amphitrite]
MKCAILLLCAVAARTLTASPITSTLYTANPADGLYSLKTGLPYAFLRKRRDVSHAETLRQRRELDQAAAETALYYSPLAYSNFGYAGLGYPYIFRKKRDLDQVAAGTDFSFSRYSRRQYINRNTYSSRRFGYY